MHANPTRCLHKRKQHSMINRLSSYLRIQFQFSRFILYFSLYRRHSNKHIEEYEVSGEEEEEEEELPVICAAVRLRSCPFVEGSGKAPNIDKITLSNIKNVNEWKCRYVFSDITKL